MSESTPKNPAPAALGSETAGTSPAASGTGAPATANAVSSNAADVSGTNARTASDPAKATTENNLADARETSELRRRAIRYVLTMGALMAGLYGIAYQSWSPDGFMGRQLIAYLETVAGLSGVVLRLLGEPVTVQNSVVSGNFSYVVVVDCAALDVQALFAAAVLAFPSRWTTRLIGLVLGLFAIFVINIARLVALYYAGSKSLDLFKTLHEEVFVLVIVGLVCGLFLAWARWAAQATADAQFASNQLTPNLGKTA